MKRKLISLISLSVVISLSATSTALAAKKPSASKPVKQQTYGIDISYPQCSKSVPIDQAFGVVGVNGGSAATTNSCLAKQLLWASKSSGIVPSQPKLQLYVNTANPGQVPEQMSTIWPASNAAPVENPYGTCTGANDQACSWQYGWERGEFAVNYFKSEAVKAGLDATPASYKWWLDVETMNTWQTGSANAYANNVAALEGWVAQFSYLKAPVGLYSTASQWNQIVGSAVSSASNLNGLDNWRPGGANLSTAKQACSATPLTQNGSVVLTQYISKNLDYNYSCV